MSYETWPTSLPRDLLLAGYSGQMGDGRLMTNTDTGPAKMRRRSSFMSDPINGSVVLTYEQLQTLMTFVEDVLEGGTRLFVIRDPMRAASTNIRALVRFVELPSWSAITPTLFNVSLKLEQLDVVQALPPVFSNAAIFDGREGNLYAGAVQIHEGRLPLRSIAVVGGGLPNGIQMSADGKFAGTPTDFGSSAFTLRVTDGDGRTVDAARSINVRPPGWIFWQDGSIIDPVVSRPAAGASYLSREGNMTGAAVNQPRFDHDANGQLKGVLVEQASTNVWANSAAGTGWVAGGNTPPAVENAHFGLGHHMVMAQFGPGNDIGFAGSHARLGTNGLVPAGTTFTHSIYMTLSRPLVDTESLFYYATGSNAASARVIDRTTGADLAGKWGRIVTAPWTPTFDSNIYPAILPRTKMLSPISVFVSYWQLEQGAVASSPILTNTGAVHRPSDVISFEMPSQNNRVVYTFDDGSTQTLNGVGPTHTIPLTLSRRHIRRIDARPQP